MEKIKQPKCQNPEDHDIGRNMIGGFPGHPHTHPSSEQICFRCGKTLVEIIEEAEKKGKENVLKEVEKNGTKVYKGQLPHGIYGLLIDFQKIKKILNGKQTTTSVGGITKVKR